MSHWKRVSAPASQSGLFVGKPQREVWDRPPGPLRPLVFEGEEPPQEPRKDHRRYYTLSQPPLDACRATALNCNRSGLLLQACLFVPTKPRPIGRGFFCSVALERRAPAAVSPCRGSCGPLVLLDVSSRPRTVTMSDYARRVSAISATHPGGIHLGNAAKAGVQHPPRAVSLECKATLA